MKVVMAKGFNGVGLLLTVHPKSTTVPNYNFCNNYFKKGDTQKLLQRDIAAKDDTLPVGLYQERKGGQVKGIEETGSQRRITAENFVNIYHKDSHTPGRPGGNPAGRKGSWRSIQQPAGSRLLGITDPATLSVEYDHVPIAT